MKARPFLAQLRRDIEQHPAVNHMFLNRLATSPMSKEDYRVFAEHHYPLVCAFTSYLELALMRAPDSEARLWIARVLVDEYGEGSQGKDHATLYAKFLAATGADAGGADARRVSSPSHRFISTHQGLLRQGTFLEGLGAVGPGHEWAIPKMFEAVIPGLRRAGFSDDEIGYFTLHVEQDDDHGEWLHEALLRYTDSGAAQDEVRRGAMASLDARLAFWSGVQSAVIRYRQPRATRPDGPTPRRLLHELALTAWDGSRLARRLEDGVQALRTQRVPTLRAVLASCRQI